MLLQESDARADDACRAAGGSGVVRFEGAAILQVPASCVLHERAPHARREPVANEQMPDEVRALVEIAHREIAEDGIAILRTTAPYRAMREQRVVAPRVAVLEFLG